VRCNLDETPEFIFNKAPKTPITVIFKEFPLSCIKAASASGLSGMMGSFLFVYLNFFLVNSLKWNINDSLLLICFAHIIAMLISPFA